jgi:hypothetical protein
MRADDPFTGMKSIQLMTENRLWGWSTGDTVSVFIMFTVAEIAYLAFSGITG